MNISVFKTLSICLLAAAVAACSEPPKTPNQPIADVDCTQSQLLNTPSDPSLPGPWSVGAKTVSLTDKNGQQLTTEIWYPAQAYSEQNKSPLQYDLHQYLSTTDAAKLGDTPMWQHCDCFADLPLDTQNGPYPVILFLHGSGSFRTASLTQAVHWASRGFVVIAADYPDLQLKDFKSNPINSLFQNQAAQTADIIEQLHSPTASLRFLANHIDSNRIGVAGHSTGGTAAASMGNIPGVRVIIPMAAGGVEPGKYVRSTFVLGAEDDKVARYAGQQMGFSTSPKPRRFLGLENAGHFAFTDICRLLPEQGGFVNLASEHGVKIPWYMSTLGRDGCGETQMPAEMSSAIIKYATTAAFEETLQCRADATNKLAATKALFPGVKAFKETLGNMSHSLAAANPF